MLLFVAGALHGSLAALIVIDALQRRDRRRS